MTIGERLQQHRKDLGLSQEELGQQLHVSRQTVSQWETDQTLPTVDNLIRLKELFGVSIDSLLSKEGSFEKEPEETPRESYQFTFSEAELRLFYRNRMFATLKRPLISLLLILFLSIIFLTQYRSLSKDIRIVLILVLIVVLIRFIILFLKTRRFYKRNAKDIALCTYQYDFYQQHFTMRIEKEGVFSSLTIIPYERIDRVQDADPFLFVYYKGSVCLLRRADLQPDSMLFHPSQMLPPKAVYQSPPRRLRKFSWVVFVLAIAALPLWLLLFSLFVLSIPDFREIAFHIAWTMFVSLFLPVASIILGCVLKSKKMAYKKNVVVGIIMSCVLFFFGTVWFLVFFFALE